MSKAGRWTWASASLYLSLFPVWPHLFSRVCTISHLFNWHMATSGLLRLLDLKLFFWNTHCSLNLMVVIEKISPLFPLPKLKKNQKETQLWWYVPVVPVCRKWREETQEPRASLSCKRPCLTNTDISTLLQHKLRKPESLFYSFINFNTFATTSYAWICDCCCRKINLHSAWLLTLD